MFKDRLTFGLPENLVFPAQLVLSLLCLCLLGPMELFTETPVPISLQSLLVILIPVLFGWRVGLLTVIIYLIIGIAGGPVFLGYTGGWERFIGSSQGFFIGFLAGAVIAGYMAENPFLHKALNPLIAMIAGHVIILLMGFYWFWQFVEEDHKMDAILNVYAPATLLKVAFSYLVVDLINRYFNRQKDLIR